MNNTVKPFIFFLILLIIIAYGSLGSDETAKEFQPFRFGNSDKLMHGIMYFLLTLSLVYGMVKTTGLFHNWQVYVVVIAAPVAYGTIMEILQYALTPDRQAELPDFFANLTGVGLAFLLAFLYYSFKISH
ncbi:MAG: VanZ family protein [Bacteroidales bacterium]|nr:VanZ family protein [Bacteroidales bacterium]